MAAAGTIKGFVIIKLPQPGDLARKKTFDGVFTFVDSVDNLNAGADPDSRTVVVSRDDQQEDNCELPLHDQNETSSPHASRRQDVVRHRLSQLASVLFVGTVAYLLWQHGPSAMMPEEELESRSDDDSDGSLIFNVHSKLAVHSSLNSSWMPSIPAYPEGASHASPSPTTNFIARDVVRYSSRPYAAAQSGPTSDPEKTSTIFQLEGNVYPDGLYYVVIRVGNPLREYFLDMDTGSDLTWLQCDAPCANCAKGPHSLYKPRRANRIDCSESACSSVQEGSKFGCDHGTGQCDYEIKYADGGYSLGVLVRDQLAMFFLNGSWGRTNVALGCAYNQRGNLAKSPAATDGVLGLSSSSVSLISQLAEQGIVKNIFAHCIAGDGEQGSYLILGDRLLTKRGISWASLVGKPAIKHYVVAVEDVFFGDFSLRSGTKGFGRAIFDSGSSYTYLTSLLYTTITGMIQLSIDGSDLQREMTDNTLPICWKSNAPIRNINEVHHIFKPLLFEFQDGGWLRKTSKMQLGPERYLITNSRGNVCLGLLDGSVMQNDELIIIGDISMRGSLVVYDNENHRLGWMKMDCLKTSKKT